MIWCPHTPPCAPPTIARLRSGRTGRRIPHICPGRGQLRGDGRATGEGAPGVQARNVRASDDVHMDPPYDYAWVGSVPTRFRSTHVPPSESSCRKSVSPGESRMATQPVFRHVSSPRSCSAARSASKFPRPSRLVLEARLAEKRSNGFRHPFCGCFDVSGQKARTSAPTLASVKRSFWDRRRSTRRHSRMSRNVNCLRYGKLVGTA